MWVPYSAWFVMAPVMMIAVLLGKEVFTLVALTLSLVATTEFARATGAHRNWPFMGAIYTADLALFTVAYLGQYAIYVSLPIFFTLIILVVPEVLGEVDAMKFRSCLTLFSAAAPQERLFAAALERYFSGEPDPKTMEMLGTGERSD
jgi:hypothetical protein